LPGTGTRALLDQQLTIAGIPPEDVPGPEVDSHFEVALAVAAGTADAGLGVRAAAADLNLDFVPLLWEHYDLALPADALDTAAPILTALRDSTTRQAVERELAGYDLTHTGRIESPGLLISSLWRCHDWPQAAAQHRIARG
jgi:molybdate-binding protein